MEMTLSAITPENLKADAQISALAKALDVELEKLNGELERVLHLPRLNELDHNVLDQLAWQFHQDFWLPERLDAETKRKLIKTVILSHKKYGTRYAVEKLLNTLTRGASVSEWFEYGGEPYHFKINLKGVPDFDDDGEILIFAINVAKNLRSWLDTLEFDLSKEHPDQILHVGLFQSFQGNIFSDLTNKIELNQNLVVKQAELIGGTIRHDLGAANILHLSTPRAGFLFIQSGKITYNADFTEFEETYSMWLNWIKLKYKNWKAAKIYWHYHGGDDIIDPTEPEIESFSGDFLKLWLTFKRSDELRLIVLPFPREDVTADDINSVNVEGILLSRRGYISDSIERAVLVRKTLTFIENRKE